MRGVVPNLDPIECTVSETAKTLLDCRDDERAKRHQHSSPAPCQR